MAYRRFSSAEIKRRLATVATVATLQPSNFGLHLATVATLATVQPDEGQTVANAASVARVEPQNANWDGAIEERAAVLEYDEGLSREEAERLAAEQVRDQRRLADEYDAAQERGEVQRPGGDRVSNVPDRNNGAATVADLGLSRKEIHEARIIRDAEPPAMHPVGWLPEPSPGVTILRPGVELPAAEYDARINAMLAALPTGSPEAKRLDFARRKGWVIDCDGERIFTKGRG